MKTIIIIGAGPAGLTAALELLQTPDEYRVILLEESDQIGGISRTVQYKGNRMDIGGHRFFSKDPGVMERWANLLPLQGAPSFDDRILHREKPLAPGGPDPESEEEVMLVRRRISRIYYLKKFFDYPITMKWATFRNMGLTRTVKAGFSYLHSVFFKKPETSLENFYINRFGKVLYSMFFEGYTEKLWGRHPRDISADWGAQRVKGLSITAVLKDMLRKLFGTKDGKNVETSLIEEFRYPKYGPGQLWETAARRITDKGGSILKNHSVRQILCEEGRIRAVVCDTPQGPVTMEGDIFLSSMPVKDLIGGMEGVSVPADIAAAAAGLPYRDFVTVGLLVDRLHLKNETDIPTLNHLVPDCWIYVQEPDVKLGRIQIFNNWSPYLVKEPETTVWIGLEYFCTEGDAFWNLSEEDCIGLAAAELEKMGVISPGAVLDAHREKVKKAYPAYFDTYAQMNDIIAYLNTFDNLYCIGRNGQHRYNNMDHSMVTAIRAVECIRGLCPDKREVWNVNTEKEYHEETASADGKSEGEA